MALKAPPRLCSTKNCARSYHAKGLCSIHYYREVTYGSPFLFHRRHSMHGLTNSPEYKLWSGMIYRCYKPTHIAYSDYGGRGIAVCQRWRDSFANFIADMGKRPTPSHSINRINNDGNYEPSNCEWVTQSVQNINQRMRSDNTSGYRGVDYHKRNNKWRVRVRWLSKVYSFGLYDTPEEAAYVRDQAALQIHGSDTTLNFSY